MKNDSFNLENFNAIRGKTGWVVMSGSRGEPQIGLSPDDAAAFCAWLLGRRYCRVTCFDCARSYRAEVEWLDEKDFDRRCSRCEKKHSDFIEEEFGAEIRRQIEKD